VVGGINWIYVLMYKSSMDVASCDAVFCMPFTIVFFHRPENGHKKTSHFCFSGASRARQDHKIHTTTL
jgi:hypothetical protein